MSKVTFRGPIVALMLVAIGAAASPVTAVPDDGKNLTRAPAPLVAASVGECNRDCLYAFVDQYFDAMLSRCPCNIAIAPAAKYTENEQAVKLGEGMWKTFSGRGTYRVYLADPASGEVGYYGDITEDAGLLPGVVALRMKVKDHRITELQMIAVREQKRPRGGLGLNTAGIMTPRILDELDPKGFVSPSAMLLEPIGAAGTRDQLVSATKEYFEAFAQSKGSQAPFDAQCAQRENGIAATNNPDGPVVDKAQPAFHLFSEGCQQEFDRGFFAALAKVRDARPLVVDEKQGLVLDLAFFDNEGDVRSVAVAGVGNVAVPAEFRRAFTLMSPQLFKIEGGKIRAIEGLSWPVPFGMRSSW
ncbi:MAG TPA: hypothetical protein VJO53_09275 [Candidatus Acidoferrales bacterium]|nr:hypothetical protein [Candidatus Acidoferrales bacterium]